MSHSDYVVPHFPPTENPFDINVLVLSCIREGSTEDMISADVFSFSDEHSLFRFSNAEPLHSIEDHKLISLVNHNDNYGQNDCLFLFYFLAAAGLLPSRSTPDDQPYQSQSQEGMAPKNAPGHQKKPTQAQPKKKPTNDDDAGGSDGDFDNLLAELADKTKEVGEAKLKKNSRAPKVMSNAERDAKRKEMMAAINLAREATLEMALEVQSLQTKKKEEALLQKLNDSTQEVNLPK